MIKIGPSRTTPDEWIYRHEDCHAGSNNWLKHFREKSSLGSLFKGMAAENFNAEEQMRVGKLVVEERKKQIEDAIGMRLKALDKKRKEGSGEKRTVGKHSGGKLKGTGSSVVIQRSRKPQERAVAVKKYRHRAV